MRPVFCLLVAVLLASPTWAQTPVLPIDRDEARTLSARTLAQLMFGAAADEVVVAEPEATYLGDTIARTTFLLRPRPAVEAAMVHYEGACAIRRVRVDLDMAEDGRSVDDITTDTVWAVLGPMSVVEPVFDRAPGEEDVAAVARQTACEGWNDFSALVEAPDLMTLMAATDALTALPRLIEDPGERVTCDDDQPCTDAHRTALGAGRLTNVGPCDDPELSQSLGITQEQTCVTLDLLLPGGSAFEYDTLRIVAAGVWAYPERFAPDRAWMAIGTTIVD